MKRTALAIVLLLTATASAAHWLPPAKYATQYTLYFEVYDSNSPWRVYETAPAAADVHVFQDGASEARAENAVTDLGRSFSLVLSIAEMTAKVVTVDVNDATNPPLFGDEVFYIPTYGHANAYHVWDISSAVPTVTTNALAAGAITAAAIATDAITSDELATSAIDEIENDLINNNNTKHSLAWYIKRASGSDPVPVEPGETAQAGGTANTIKLAATSSATNNAYVPMLVELTGGTGAPANRTIISYNGTTKVATVDKDWPGSAPNATTTYVLSGSPSSSLGHEGLAQAGDATHITLASEAPSVSSITGWIVLRSGTGAPDTQEISAYDGSTKVITVTGWSGDAPSTDTYYALIPTGNIVSDTPSPGPTIDLSEIYQTVQNAVGEISVEVDASTLLGASYVGYTATPNTLGQMWYDTYIKSRGY